MPERLFEDDSRDSALAAARNERNNVRQQFIEREGICCLAQLGSAQVLRAIAADGVVEKVDRFRSGSQLDNNSVGLIARLGWVALYCLDGELIS